MFLRGPLSSSWSTAKYESGAALQTTDEGFYARVLSCCKSRSRRGGAPCETRRRTSRNFANERTSGRQTTSTPPRPRPPTTSFSCQPSLKRIRLGVSSHLSQCAGQVGFLYSTGGEAREARVITCSSEFRVSGFGFRVPLDRVLPPVSCRSHSIAKHDHARRRLSFGLTSTLKAFRGLDLLLHTAEALLSCVGKAVEAAMWCDHKNAHDDEWELPDTRYALAIAWVF